VVAYWARRSTIATVSTLPRRDRTRTDHAE
jgi:hypothetical protein